MDIRVVAGTRGMFSGRFVSRGDFLTPKTLESPKTVRTLGMVAGGICQSQTVNCSELSGPIRVAPDAPEGL